MSSRSKTPKPPKEPNEYPIGWAIHQMKNERKFRDTVVAKPGYTYVEFDAAGQEFRWFAIASGDTTMLQLCMPGEDAHSFMGSKINPKITYPELLRRRHDDKDKEAKLTRKSGKVGNLSLQYRTSAKKFCSVARVQYEMPMTLPEAERIRFVYLKTYRGVEPYWTSQISKVKQLGYVETFAGRRVQVVGDWTGSYGWSMGSTAINYRIQGTGGDQKYLALAELDELALDTDAIFRIDLHDGLYHEVPDDRVTEFTEKGKRILDNLHYREAWGFDPPIPLTWDAKVGKTWGSLKEVDL